MLLFKNISKQLIKLASLSDNYVFKNIEIKIIQQSFLCDLVNKQFCLLLFAGEEQIHCRK
ncbi:hypothetical protein BpHYR1_037148 [Brachionus plicatilis]|uniref:Uncharacterized protein n=1 Tax=Brachionus plicatilis TaxID=10195 RepID=A0A3M7QCN3_BRAPC|nr:hypothetical protein BpHYR1_037148 [Brachionus plicatilis]